MKNLCLISKENENLTRNEIRVKLSPHLIVCSSALFKWQKEHFHGKDDLSIYLVFLFSSSFYLLNPQINEMISWHRESFAFPLKWSQNWFFLNKQIANKILALRKWRQFEYFCWPFFFITIMALLDASPK